MLFDKILKVPKLSTENNLHQLDYDSYFDIQLPPQLRKEQLD